MSMRCWTSIIAAAVVTTMFVLPADARAKKQKRPAVVQTQQVPSLDGRITGRMRTCGFDLLQYDRRGMPYGPYCHCPAAPGGECEAAEDLAGERRR
jgi:hypothetical protein